MRLNARVTAIDADSVQVKPRSATAAPARGTHRPRCVIWAAGVAASPLGRQLAQATGAPADRAGRVIVEPDLSLPGHPGDQRRRRPGRREEPCAGPGAARRCPASRPAPSRWAARRGANILRRIAGKPTRPFRYRDYGNLATIGRNAAVVDLSCPVGPLQVQRLFRVAVLAVRAHLFPDRLSQPHRGADRLGFALLEQAALCAGRHRHRAGLGLDDVRHIAVGAVL